MEPGKIGPAIPSVVELLEELDERSSLPNGEKIAFGGVGERDVYNITAPFQIGGETVIAGRVESRDSELAKAFFSSSGTVCGGRRPLRRASRSYRIPA